MDPGQITIPVRDFGAGVAIPRAFGPGQIVQESDARFAGLELPSQTTTFPTQEEPNAAAGGVLPYLEVDDMDRKHAGLRATGLVFHTAPTDGDRRWRKARFTDPTGNRFCLFHAGPDRRFPPWRLPVRAT